MSIIITNLSKTYGTQKAVNNISFNVGKGEIVGFLGPNGAGKSTTMKMITGYLDADAGSINVSGIDVSKENIESKKKIGYLPEANPLYFEMYVREYLHFVAGIHQINNATERVEEIIKTVGLLLEANKKIGQLSKGYKQRVGLAAALIHEPEVLILDEPTSGLDPNQIVEIRNVIKALSKNKTVLFSSHILQEVEAICDRVIIINKGNIVADDSLQNLQKNDGKQLFVSVSFQEEVSKDLLINLLAVESISVNGNKFRIQTTNAENLRKQLLQLSIDKNLNIVSLQNESSSLEDVFRDLTNNKPL
ncbi:MAG: gliding motility-associated ABC transporter ATP-binding subunit GldA [Ferruginibacter sp.]|nr:gliding motility-associated ABC transporter ATP-binding subunit GldA [Ferruginibacter sp.]